MKRIYSILIIICMFSNIFPAMGTSYTWTGNTSTAWNTTSNWSPSGVPGIGDYVTISASGTYHPVLTSNITINGISISGGTVDLNGDTLLLSSGASSFGGGTISNGLVQMRGTDMTFSSTVFDATIDAVVNRINLNGGTFNNYCYFETTTNVPGTGSGGAVFNDSVYLYHNYTGAGIWVMNNSTGHTFNGKLTIYNKGTKEITFAGAGINVFNGDIVLINTGAGGIMFGNDTLTAGHTMSIGSGGFSAGDFNATNFYQSGNTPVTLTFTGTALPSITGATFGGDFSITSNVLLFKNCTFYGTAAFTATGSGSSNWYGGNKFYGNATFTNNASAGNLRLDADTANTYYANATFNGSRELRVCYGNYESSFYGNITTGSLTTFNAGTGTLCLAGSGTQSLSFGGSNPVKNLKLNKSGGSASLTTALTVSGSITFANGNLTTSSSNLLTINNGGSVLGASDSSFIDGPVKKIGNAAFVFPTGKGHSYRAIEISAPSNTTDAFTGEYFNTGQTLGNSMDTTVNTISSCNYWNLNRNTGSSNVTVKFQFDSTACDWNKPDSAHIGYWNGTKWVDKGVGIFDSIYIKSVSAISNFGNFLFSYNLNHPTIGGLLNYAVVSNDSLILNDTLRVFDLSAARNTNDVYKLIDSTYFTSNSSDVEALKLKIQSEKTLMKNLSSTVLTTGQIVGQTLTAGVYKVNGSLTIDDFTILQGDTSSIFVFNISGNLNIINNCAINLDGVRGYNVFFNVDSSITISGTTFLNGLFFAGGNITVNDGFSGQAALYSLNKIIINSATDVYSPYRIMAPQLQHLIDLAACGLNYAQVTVNLHQRIGGPTQLGMPQPTSLNFSLTNVLPMQAYLFFTLVSNGTPPNIITPITFNNVNYNAVLRQALPDATCWESNGYRHTASYLVNIPVNAVNLSGANTISGLPTAGGNPDMDTDGACLFLIYRDECGNNNQRAWGYISMDYGLAINQNGVINEQLSVYTLPSFNPPIPVIFAANAFMLVGDYETNVNNPNLSINNTNLPMTGTMFNFGAVGYNPNTFMVRYHSAKNGSDCGNLSLIGAYYSVRNTNLCPDFTLSTTTTNSCQSSASGSIDLTVTPAGTYTYEWSNAATTQDLTGIAPGTYIVTVTNPNGCFHQLTVTVNSTVVTVNISVQNSPPFCASNYPILSANVSSGTSPYTYQWYDSGGNPIGGATQSTYQVPGFGTYSVIVTDANGCTGTNSIVASEDVINVSISQTPITCHNQNNGSLTAMPAGGGITYLWSNSATTQTINNLSAGTYTVTVTQNGCTASTSATITNPPTLTVSVTLTNVTCQGGNDGTATATPSGGVMPYTYLWSNSNTTANLTGLIAGNYSVTVTDANGCTATANTNIGFTFTLPPAPVITGGAAVCTQNGTYTVTNLLAGATYQWSTSNNLSGSTIPATGITFQGNNPGSITFTVTDSNGCSNSSTFNVYACCAPDVNQVNMDISNLSVSDMINNPPAYPYFTYDPNTTLASINMGGWTQYQTNPVLIINGTFTVDEKITITTSEIILGPQAKIIIDEGYYLALEGCYLHACNGNEGYMWDGIYVNGTSNSGMVTYLDAGTYGRSFIEDMENGIVTTGYGHLEAPSCVFNKNYKTVQHINCPGQNGSFMFSSVIECVDDIFSATPSPANSLITPYFGRRSFSGIELNNVNDINIGYDDMNLLAPPISFFNLDNGILSLNSSAGIRSCLFENITTNSNPLPGPYFGFQDRPSGLGIGAVALGTIQNIDVGTAYPSGGVSSPACTFRRSTNGIFLMGNINSTIEGNTFNDINVGQSFPWLNNITGQSAIASFGGNNLSVTITNNTFNNFINGVHVVNKRSSTINISENEFNKSASGLTGRYGIMVERVHSVLPYFLNTVTIDRNEMHNITDAGIILRRERGAQVMDNNPINILAPTTPWPFRVKGISLINTSQCTVQGNRIEATNLNPPALSDENRVFGIELQSATSGLPNDIASNHIEHTGRGIASLLNYTAQTLQCNNLDENYTGVWLFSSNIGNQLNGGTDQNNSWTLLGGQALARGIVATGSTPIPAGTWFFIPPLGLNNSQMSPPLCVTFLLTSKLNTCPSAPLRQSQQWLVDVAYEQNYGDSLSNDEKYLAKKQVYLLLKSDDSLMLQGTAEDTILRNWYDSTAVANIGLFSSVTDSIDANLLYAIAVNESIIPENHAEENEKAVNAIYFTTWALDTFDLTTEQYEILYAIANENPLTGGSGVYAARVMLGLHIDDDYEGSSSRMAGNVKNQNSASSLTDNRVSLMPNPAKDESVYRIILNKNETGQVILYSKLGVKILNKQLAEGNNTIVIPLSELGAGVYFVQSFIRGKNIDNRKLVVVK